MLRQLSGQSDETFSQIDNDVLAMGYKKSQDTAIWQTVFGVYRISSQLDDSELTATVTKLMQSCGGVRSDGIFVSTNESTLGRCAIIEVRSAAVVEHVKAILTKSPLLRGSADIAFFDIEHAHSGGGGLRTVLAEGESDERRIQVHAVLEGFLKSRLLDGKSSLSMRVVNAFKNIFSLTSIDEIPDNAPSDRNELLEIFEDEQLLEVAVASSSGTFSTVSVAAFLHSLACSVDEATAAIGQRATSSSFSSSPITPKDMLTHLTSIAKSDPGRVYVALGEYGFDLHFERYKYQVLEAAMEAATQVQWLPELDHLLLRELDELSDALHIESPDLSPSDYAPTARRSELFNHFDIVEIRLRICVLLELNSRISEILPAVDFRDPLPTSLATLLVCTREYMLYDVKVQWLDNLIDSTAQREESTGPEIALDPLDSMSTRKPRMCDTHFMQALHLMEHIDPVLLRVKLARGSDPIFPINVRLVGEAVLGSSGSFREFLVKVASELQESARLPVFVECPSAEGGENLKRFILRPGAVDYATVRLLEFLGVVFAMAMRAEVPMGLDVLPVFWKALVDEKPTRDDLRDVDFLLIQKHDKLLALSRGVEFDEFIERENITLCCRNLEKTVIDLGPAILADGKSGVGVLLSFEHRQQYVDEVEQMWQKDLLTPTHIAAIRRGIRTVIPIEPLRVMTGLDIETRVCGKRFVDLAFLKTHTNYTVGLSESDPHIGYFWTALESFTQEQLRKFVKFSCNQQRIPSSCPCQKDSSKAHVPPFPMKIAPPDPEKKGHGSKPSATDKTWIRAETCLFMLKLPPYSTQAVMNEHILNAILCRGEPRSC